MTPEAAHEEGKRVAHEFVAPGDMAPVSEVMHFIGATVRDTITPLHIRGAADFFRELAAELEARAAALEATR